MEDNAWESERRGVTQRQGLRGRRGGASNKQKNTKMPPKASPGFPSTRPPRPAGPYRTEGTISGGSGKATHGPHPREWGGHSAETGRSPLHWGGFTASGPRWRPGGSDRAAEPPPVSSAPPPFSPRGQHSPPGG